MLYAITDIETTGSYAAANGITEIAIHISDGRQVVETYQTLINPGQSIPRFIQAMTGITDSMVTHAPRFAEVANEIYTLLADKIFVAHNVNFDYSFVKAHLEASGYSFNTKKLCTVRLGRKIFPGLPSYSLGKFCHSMGIQINDRHRAGGDAAATAELFHRMVENDTEEHIAKSLQRNSKEQLLPPNVPKAHFEKLPSTPGVYYFHNEKGKIIYVGKAKNIRNRVTSHFSSDLDSKQKQSFIRHTHAISFQPVATELMAQILESSEIKKLWPVYNYSQKKWEDVYGIFSYEDQNGYLRLAIEKNKKQLRPLYSFHYLVDGHAILRKLIREFNLCPKLCFMQTDPGPCEGMKEETCFGACEKQESMNVYNKRLEKAIASLYDQPSFLIVEKGLQKHEQSCIAVNRGSFTGMGYVPGTVSLQDFAAVREYLTPYRENSFIRNLVHGYAARYPSKVVLLDNTGSYSLH
jgi:DNA polymerase III subunit epsilon